MPSSDPSGMVTPRLAQLDIGFECVESVRRLIASGQLPATKINGRWRIRRSDLDAFIAERSSNPEARPNALAEHVAGILENAQTLTAAQRETLAELLRPIRGGGTAAR